MGWIAQFLSRAVVTGFLFGAAIDVVIGELPKLTGTESTGSNSFQELWSWLTTLGQVQGSTAVVGVVALVVVFGLQQLPLAFPVLWCLLSVGCWRRGCSTSASVVWCWSPPCPAGCPGSKVRA